MRILLNDKEVVFPSSLAEFTLGQRIDFHNRYGKDLEEMARSVDAMEDGPEKELERTHLFFERMIKTFAFFTGAEEEALKESEFIDDIYNIYQSNMLLLFTEEEDMVIQTEYIWNNEIWELHPPELKHGSKMTFGEFIDSKQLVKDMMEVGSGKWDYMLPLCAIYLRKKGEAYQKEFLYEGSDRMELMKQLPMSIALAVGFFLSGSVDIYLKTSQYSGNQKSNLKEVDTVPDTSKDLAGSIS